MNTENNRTESEEERELLALFDQTAEEPSQVALQRMARAAAQIPEARQPWYRKLWGRHRVALGAAAVAAAAVVAVVATDSDKDGPVAGTTGTPSVETALTPTPVPDAELDEVLAFELTTAESDEELAALDVDPLGSFEADADLALGDDHPVSVLSVLFVDDAGDIELLSAVMGDMLEEGG